MELQGEERALYEKLMTKYTDLSTIQEANGASLTQSLAQPDTSPSNLLTSGAGKDIDMRLCPDCNSSGTIVEEYNFRRLEKCCQKCDGRGATFYKNGQPLTEANSSQQETASEKSAAKSSSSNHNAAKSAKEQAAIGAKISQYEQELAGLEASMCSGSTDKQQEDLQQQLLQQLILEIQRLTRRKEQLQQSQPTRKGVDP